MQMCVNKACSFRTVVLYCSFVTSLVFLAYTFNIMHFYCIESPCTSYACSGHLALAFKRNWFFSFIPRAVPVKQTESGVTIFVFRNKFLACSELA